MVEVLDPVNSTGLAKHTLSLVVTSTSGATSMVTSTVFDIDENPPELL